jgi:hypothetical protein
MPGRSIARWGVALAVWLAPAVAAACPYCATGSGGGTGLRIALGAFILLPFVVAGVVYRVVRVQGQQ